jgi:putative ABC transport system permease protein
MALFSIAWRNLWRHRRRSLITAAGMGIGVAVCMAMIALMDGMNAQMFDVLVTQSLGHVQLHNPEYPARKQLYDTIGDIDVILERIEASDTPAAVSARVFSFGLAASAETSTGARLEGIDPDREEAVSRLAQRVTEGRYLPEEPGDEVLMGAGLADTLKVGVGDELVMIVQAADGSMGNALYTIVGLVKTGNAMMDRSGVYAHISEVQSLLALEEQAHEIVMLAEDEDEIPALAERVRADFGGDAPGGGYLVRTWSEADPQSAQLIQVSEVSVYFMLVVVFGVAGLGVLNTMLMAVLERTRELGLLRSLGLTPRQIRRLVLLEAALLAALSSAVGLVLGGLLDAWLVAVGMDFSVNEGQGIDYQGVTLPPYIKGEVHPEGIVVTVIFVIAVSIIAAIWPAWRASRLNPVDAMRQV